MARVYMQAATFDDLSKCPGFVLGRPDYRQEWDHLDYSISRLEFAIGRDYPGVASDVGSIGPWSLPGHPSLPRYRNS